MDGQSKSGVQCVEFEALLAEALDATLQGATLVAFEEHQKSCPAVRGHVPGSRGRHALVEGS